MIVDDFCDYCGASEPRQLRIVGTIPEGEDLGGLPLAKMWCGECEAPDDIDRDAQASFLNKLNRKRREGER